MFSPQSDIGVVGVTKPVAADLIAAQRHTFSLAQTAIPNPVFGFRKYQNLQSGTILIKSALKTRRQRGYQTGKCPAFEFGSITKVVGRGLGNQGMIVNVSVVYPHCKNILSDRQLHSIRIIRRSML